MSVLPDAWLAPVVLIRSSVTNPPLPRRWMRSKRSSRLADRKSSHALEKGTPWSIIAGSQERGTHPGSPPKAQTPIIAQATVTANQIRHCHGSAVPPAGERLLDNPPKGQAVHRQIGRASCRERV